MNDGRTCNNYCNFFFSCFSVTSNKLYFAWVYSNIVSKYPNLDKDRLCKDSVLQTVLGVMFFPLH